MPVRLTAAQVVLPLVALALLCGSHLTAGGALAAPIVTESIAGPLTPEDLANELVGGGVAVSNVTYTGADVAAGTFSGGTDVTPFDSGIILSTGTIANVIGPNDQDDVSAVNNTPGDADLNGLSGFSTFDAAVLEFDFVPQTDTVSFVYVFASDEYNEYVNTEFNDVFAFYVNGVNCATVSGDPVSINTVNNGNPFGIPPNSHPELYVNNDASDGGGSLATEMDGLTVELTCESTVDVGNTNHIKLAIADGSDRNYDSDVFLKSGSFLAVPSALTLDPPTSTNNVGEEHTVTAAIVDDQGQPMQDLPVVFTVTNGPNAGSNGSGTTDANGEVPFAYTGNGGAGTDTIQACVTDTDVCDTATEEWVQPATPTPTATATTTPTAVPTTPEPSPIPPVVLSASSPSELPNGGGPPRETGSAVAGIIVALALASAGLAAGGAYAMARRRRDR